MQTAKSIHFCRYETKKSTFIGYIAPMNEFEALYAKLKSEHSKATHIVWAYRYINEFDQIVEKGSDDGEPKGTSAQPVLNVLKGAKIVNICAFIVRYFGGIKLGMGGLVRAYSATIKMTLKEVDLISYEKKEKFCFACQYHFVQKVEYFLDKVGVEFKNRDFKSEKVVWELNITVRQKDKIEQFLLDNFVQ
jgi:uncharacterized YigZ family protein